MARVNELLHCHATDKTRTDDENRNLCLTFSDFFVSKIAQLKSAISAKLTSLPCTPAFHDSPHSGPPLSYLPPEVHKIVASSPGKSSSTDYIPTSLIKACPGVFPELIAELANLSFREGHFPTSFKSAVIIPLIKKPSLDKSIPSNTVLSLISTSFPKFLSDYSLHAFSHVSLVLQILINTSLLIGVISLQKRLFNLNQQLFPFIR